MPQLNKKENILRLPKQKTTKKSLRMKATLRRGSSFSQLKDSDVKYIWAAYKMGGMPEDVLPQGLSKEQFMECVVDFVGAVSNIYILRGSNKGVSDMPIALVASLIIGQRMEPHVTWFPWATSRNKVETSINFINEMRKNYKLHIISSMDDVPFFNHLCRYGIVQRIGKRIGYYANGDHAMFYQERIKE